jgi:excisionase family DNA binding protein
MARTQTRPIAADPLPEADRLLTAEVVAEMVGVTVDYIWALCRADEIPHLRLGRALRFRRSSVLKWIEEREQGGLD